DRSIDNVLVNVQFVPDDASEIDRGVIAGGQHQALFNLVTGEMCSIRDVAKIVVRADPTDPCGKVCFAVDGKSKLVSLCCREIHNLPIGFFTKIAEFGASV